MGNKVCPKCGTSNEADAKFCVGCANQFSSEIVSPQVTAAPQYQQGGVPSVPPAPQQMYTGGNMQNNQFNAQPVQQMSMQVNNQIGMPYSMGKWIGLLLLQMFLPGLGSIIALIICLTSDNTTVRNFGKAQLVLMIIIVVLTIIGTIISVVLFGGLAALIESTSSSYY